MAEKEKKKRHYMGMGMYNEQNREAMIAAGLEPPPQTEEHKKKKKKKK